MKEVAFIDELVEHFNTTPNATVRETANFFGISKTRVHYYLTKIRPNEESLRILAKNKAERHIRGGQATKNKYLKTKKGC